MANQTLIFVVLPNGMTADKRLRCSIFLTPRLDGGATLAAFPDFLNWPKLVKQSGLKFQFSSGGKTTTVAANTAVLQPDDWAKVFSPEIPVDPYTLPNFDKRLVVSYPAREAMAFLKHLYPVIGTDPGGSTFDEGFRSYKGLLGRLAFGQDDNPNLAQVLQQTRSRLWTEQLRVLDSGGNVGAPVLTTSSGIQTAIPPDGVPASVMPPASTDSALRKFALFHNMPPAPHRPPLPATPADFAKTMDYHRALTALSSYPALLRAFGLVFDVELPADFCATSPTEGAFGTIALDSVTPGFPWKIAPEFSFPRTAYVLDTTTFWAAPAASPDALAQNPYPASDTVAGYLVLSPDSFHLVQVDIDGVLLKTLALANSVRHVGGTPSIAAQSAIDGTLPAMRSSGIALMANGRGLQMLQSFADNHAFDQALTTKSEYPRPFSANDLVRGYRLDIWSSRTGKWHSLHRRNSTYQLGPAGSQKTLSIPDEEGFLQPSASEPAEDPTRMPDAADGVPDSSTDLYIHERVAAWNGWSLSAPRPGLPLNRDVDPGKALDPDPTLNEPVTSFKLKTAFKAVAGSLPALRYGDSYRVRARTVDLAGNSLPLASTAPDPVIQPGGAVGFPYRRFEPVSPPLVVEQKKPGAGAALERLVIRSANSQPALDAVLSPYQDSRHIAPPRVAEAMVERHGMLDAGNGHLKGDAATFKLIRDADLFQLPLVDGAPLDPSPTFKVGYLPDPIARGAAFTNLPNTPDDTSGRLAKGVLRYQTLPDVQVRPGSVTFIDFGAQWPARQAFLLTLVEGDGPPVWDAGNRILTVFLPKAGDFTVELSSYLSEADLELMAVWEWMREYFDALEVDAFSSGAANNSVTGVSDLVALLTRLVLEGGHPMITPSRSLNLVHAVQQPLGRPSFQQLPVVHNTAAPIFASALRNAFTPITAWRTLGSHNAVLLGGLSISGRSSSKIDIEAQMQEVTDGPALPPPTRAWHSQHVEAIDLPSLAAGTIFADSTKTRMLATYIPEVDMLWFAAPFDTLDGVQSPTDVAAPVHRFDDTKHRWVSYTAVATTRFQEFFPEPGLKFTRESEPLVVDVPSSARPLAPEVAYIVPTFGWENQQSSNVKSSVRFGNGLRVYLERPWFSSGDDELLGVVLWADGIGAPDTAQRERYKSYISQWGGDPIWQTGWLPLIPGIHSFTSPAAVAQGLALEETADIRADVAAFPVAFDEARGMWYCDIEFQATPAYMPFVRLALARYQSHSITGVELSRVVLADFAQLSPDRSAVLLIDPSSPGNARLFVGGPAPEGPRLSTIQVVVQERWVNVVSDAGWVPASSADVTITPFDPGAEAGAVLWAGAIRFTKAPPADRFRVVILESENITVDATDTFAGVAPPPGSRVVYTAIIPYNYP